MVGRAGDELERVEPGSRAEWRQWLQANHGQAESVWLVMPKKDSGLAGVVYPEAVDEALCFGRVDSLPRKLDDRRSMVLMSPRKAGSNWSGINKAKVKRLQEAGLLATPGLAVIEAAKRDGSWNALDAVERLEVPPDLSGSFSPAGRANWDAFPRSVRRGILEWIQNAKTPVTRAKRIEDTVEKAERNERANQWRKP